MSEYLQNDREKQDKLKQIIKSLHAGASVDEVKKDFAVLIKNVSPEEISAMENALIQEGFPPEEIQALCDVHVSVFESTLKKHKSPKNMPGHPIRTYIDENKRAREILKSLKKKLGKLKSNKPAAFEDFRRELKTFKEIEKHFARKENQLFPYLERTGFEGPSKVMWGKHDEIRGMLKSLETALDEGDINSIKTEFKSLSQGVKNLLFMEEKILYPTASRRLSSDDWAEIQRGEPDIGYAWIKPGALWEAGAASREGSAGTAAPAELSRGPGQDIPMQEGELTQEQLNLMLTNLPLDLTYVDENDKVRYYSASSDRIFPRSPGIIGRSVQNCHPPKSVHIVEQIVESFRKKEKDAADFWINFEGRFVYIRYFPLFKNGEYKGVVELSQDVTDIRKLEGERRLLDW
ncbi:MAG: DUF438 domain-containing protein [Spirochaetia bacterium]